MNKPAEHLITQHLDTWTQAIETKSTAGRGSSNKLNLVGIQKLRELILEMAVRGLLVPQNPNDEPAGKLLEKIAAEKAQLIKDKKIKKTKALPEISEEEKPFNLPAGWEWARLIDVYDVRDGTHDSPKAQPSGFPLVTSKNLSSGKLDLSDIKFITKEAHLKIQERSKVDLGDILFAMIGSIGNPVIVDLEDEFSIKNVALFKYYNSDLASSKFLKYFLEHASVEMKEKAAGGVQSFVSLTFLRAFLIGVPPLEEQKRIVAKVDELMALCDQLESQTLDSIATHQTLVETLLGNLVNPENTANFDQAWSLIAENFDVLFTTEHSIDTLKQTILQLAVMGKLVPQNPNDEPAGKLLEKIAAEKAQFIADKKIKPLPEITEEEKPFDLPNGWEWVRLGNCGICFTGKTPSTKNPEFFNGDLPFIGPGQITPNKKLLNAEKFLTESGVNESVEALPNDILMVCIGGSIGKSIKIEERLSFNQQINSIRPILINSSYLDLGLSSDSFQEALLEKATGSATPIINRGKWEALTVPIPPKQEQTRIVTKVNELMVICDQLKTQLQTAQQTQIHLAQSIAQEALV